MNPHDERLANDLMHAGDKVESPLAQDSRLIQELAALKGRTFAEIHSLILQGDITEADPSVKAVRKRLANEDAEIARVAKSYGISTDEAAQRIANGMVMNAVSFGEVAASLAGQWKGSSRPLNELDPDKPIPCPICGEPTYLNVEHKCMEKFTRGAQREQQKLAYYDMPFEALDRVARIAHEGMTRYGKRNWVQGIPADNFFDHAIEHLRKWRTGDLSEDHLAKAAWNILAMMATEIK